MSENRSKKAIFEREFSIVATLVVGAGALLLSFPLFFEEAVGEIDWITIPMVAFPILASIILLALASQQPRGMKEKMAFPVKAASLGFSLFILAISSALFFGWLGSIDWTTLKINEYNMNHEYTWINSLGISWHVGLDGLSFPMLWLTTLIIPITMITTWEENSGWYHHPLLLLMEGALIGVFVALDMFMFYVFWELTLIPMFFLILKWGGKDRRYAAQKFFLYTFTASVIMLLGIVTLYFLQDPSQYLIDRGVLTGRTFSMIDMTNNAQMAANDGSVWLGESMQNALFLMLMLGFLVKLPAVPFHTWLPDAHVQAPTSGSMVLAGVMLKMGAYGMFRLPLTLFPHALAEYQYLLLAIGMISLVYGSIVCLGQTNLKRMVAYSSVSHMGIVILGIASMQPLGFAGAIFMMFAHGIISPMLFSVCGSFKHHYHTLEIGSTRGLAKASPFLGVYMMFSWMASLGLPLLAGFVAEITVLVAVWMTFGWWVLLPALVLVITAGYYLWSMQRTIFEGSGEVILPENMAVEDARDISPWENIGNLLMALLIVLFGVLPWIIWDMMSAYANAHFYFNMGGLLNLVAGGA
jgi:NADH-quinone oxidoreductase subunit M